MARVARQMWSVSNGLGQGRAFSIIVAVCVTLLVDNWLRGAFHLLALEHIRGGADWDTLHARPSPLGGEAGDTSTAPGWKLPAEYKAQVGDDMCCRSMGMLLELGPLALYSCMATSPAFELQLQ